MVDVKERPVIEFDHFSPEYARDWRGVLAARHASGSALAWTEAHGGYWLVTGYEAVKQASIDYELFTSVNDINKNRNGGGGVLIPARPYQLTLNEEDPPICLKYRMLEAPYFSPKFIKGWEVLAKAHLRDAINGVIEKGECDLIADIGQPVTAKTTLHIVGVPESEWAEFALPAHKTAFTPSTDPDYPLDAVNRIRERLSELLNDRRANPREDILTKLAQATIDGDPIEHNAALNMVIALVLGGFDTTVTLAAHALLWLQDQPEARERLLAEPTVMDNAVDEFLRAFTPANATARTAVRDADYFGVRLRKGDRVLLSWAGANRDPDVFADPDSIRIDRPNAKDHLAFGGGSHRCLGAPLAKLEAKMIISEFLRRVPGYRAIEGKVQPYPSAGLINGFIKAPVAFPPGNPE